MSIIIVATDGSPAAKAAAEQARELAAATGDTLLFLTVWRELRGDFGLPYAVIVGALDVEREWAHETVDAGAAEAREQGLAAEVAVRHGDPADEICAVARDRGARLIAIGTRGWGVISGAVFGSVAQRVVRHAPCPVLVVPAPDASPHPQAAGRESADA